MATHFATFHARDQDCQHFGTWPRRRARAVGLQPEHVIHSRPAPRHRPARPPPPVSARPRPLPQPSPPPGGSQRHVRADTEVSAGGEFCRHRETSAARSTITGLARRRPCQTTRLGRWSIGVTGGYNRLHRPKCGPSGTRARHAHPRLRHGDRSRALPLRIGRHWRHLPRRWQGLPDLHLGRHTRVRLIPYGSVRRGVVVDGSGEAVLGAGSPRGVRGPTGGVGRGGEAGNAQ